MGCWLGGYAGLVPQVGELAAIPSFALSSARIMNRIDRISAILTQLQSKKVVKGQDIADRFGMSLRTVYRDIKALEEAGVPIIGEPGTGYSIMEGYRLPPVMFTKEEAIALMTAEKLVEKFTDTATYDVYSSALFKIKAVLRSDDKHHVESMSDYIQVLGNPYLPKDKKTSNHIQVLLKGIAQKTVVAMDYFANHSQEATARKIEPVGIYHMFSQWYAIAFCWLRNDYRSFRVDRILKLSLTGTAYKKEHPPLSTYLTRLTCEKKELHEVVMSVEKSAMQFIGEQKYYSGFVSERVVGDRVEMTFLTASLRGFAHWYMMLGGSADIISPAALKGIVAGFAREILKKTEL